MRQKKAHADDLPTDLQRGAVATAAACNAIPSLRTQEERKRPHSAVVTLGKQRQRGKQFPDGLPKPKSQELSQMSL